MVIGESVIEIKERHSQILDLNSIPDRILHAMRAVEGDRLRMKKWQSQEVAIDDIAAWANESVSKQWGKRAAARVFHICESGRDIEIEDRFAGGAATENRSDT